MKFVVSLVSLILSSLLLVTSPARAEGIEVGATLICDTQEQVSRFVTLYDGDTQTAIHAVNTEEHDPTACVVAAVAYVPGPPLAMARNKNQTFQIVQILVLRVLTPGGPQAVQPTLFFSIRAVDERDA